MILFREFEEVVKPADKRRTAGKLYLPKAWIGKKVIVYLKGNKSKQWVRRHGRQ